MVARVGALTWTNPLASSGVAVSSFLKGTYNRGEKRQSSKHA